MVLIEKINSTLGLFYDSTPSVGSHQLEQTILRISILAQLQRLLSKTERLIKELCGAKQYLYKQQCCDNLENYYEQASGDCLESPGKAGSLDPQTHLLVLKQTALDLENSIYTLFRERFP